MNPSFAHPGRTILCFAAATLAALLAYLIPGLLLQAINPFHAEANPAFFRLLVGSSMAIGPALLFLIQRTREHGLRLLGLGLVVYAGVAEFMALFETLAFNWFLGFGPAAILYLLASQSLSALILLPLVISIAGKWRPPSRIPDSIIEGWLPTPPSFWIRTALLSLLWYFCYMAAGFFVADPVTHSYYAAKMPNMESINAWLFPLQLLRGTLWVLLFVLAARLMNRPLAEAGLLLGLLFGIFHAAGLLLPNEAMPLEVRLSHLPEIVLSLAMMGGLTIGTLGYRRKA